MCAFGAGAAHAALLALALPIMITLPAPADKAQGTVAIQVVVRSTPPPMLDAARAETAALPLPAFLGEGDIDEDALLPAVPLGEVTGALPEIPVAPAAPSVLQAHAVTSKPQAIVPAPPAETAGPAQLPLVRNVPAPAADTGVGREAIASIESQEASETPSAIVPIPLRKPAVAAIAPPAPPAVRKPVRKARVRPRPRIAAPNRERAAAAQAKSKSSNKGFLGGRQAITMPEYPFANR